MLGGLGLEFARGGDVGDESAVHVENVLAANIVAQLAHCFEERLGFNVTNGATNFGDDNIRCDAVLVGLFHGENGFFDGVCDVWNDLYGATEVAAAPFFGDDVGVDASGGDVSSLRHGDVEEAFVVSEI